MTEAMNDLFVTRRWWQFWLPKVRLRKGVTLMRLQRAMTAQNRELLDSIIQQPKLG